MFNYIKNQANEVVDSIKEFEASEYFSLNYKDGKKFSLTMVCIGIGLLGTGYLLDRLIKNTKNCK